MADAHGPDYPARVGRSGTFTVHVPPGRYYAAGSSPHFDGGHGQCNAIPHLTTARSGQSAHVDIVCQIR